MLQEPISRVIVHSTIGKVVFEADVRVKFSDFDQGENGNNAVMPLSLGFTEINREVVRAV